MTEEKISPVKIYYGASLWGRKEWLGLIYPERTREKDFLSEYIKHFNAVELNATHYKRYSPEEIKKWADKAQGMDFLFCPKIPQEISHYSSFLDIEDKTKAFVDSISAFEEHLGCVLLQVSDKFSPKRKESVYEYLKSLPRTIQFFLEVRHPRWFEKENFDPHLKFLKENGIGFVINDTPDRILKVDFSITKCFIRYTPTEDLTKVKVWFEQIKEWVKEGLTEAYFFVQPAELADNNTLQLEALQYFKKLIKES